MKKVLYLLFVGVTIISLTGCGEKNSKSNVQKDTGSSSQSSSQVDTNTVGNIDLQKAKEIALSDAGFSENDVTDLSYEKDDDEDKYDVSFKNGGKEYDYDISLSGDILNKSVENDD